MLASQRFGYHRRSFVGMLFDALDAAMAPALPKHAATFEPVRAWRDGSVSIRFANIPPRTVEADILGDVLAVHRHYISGKLGASWAVSHLATGLLISGDVLMTKKQACCAAEAIEGLADWDKRAAADLAKQFHGGRLAAKVRAAIHEATK